MWVVTIPKLVTIYTLICLFYCVLYKYLLNLKICIRRPELSIYIFYFVHKLFRLFPNRWTGALEASTKWWTTVCLSMYNHTKLCQ
jgi:hypothetical protein